MSAYMPWNLDNNRPIYLQIVERIQMDIVSGVYHAGDKLPSVRELAAEAAVNPNTMQKALSELEGSGLVYTQRTNGRYITDDASLITAVRRQLAKEQIDIFLNNMQKLGFRTDDALTLAEQIIKEEEG